MKRSLCLSVAAGLAAAAGQAQAQTYFNSGRTYTVLNGGATNFVGFSSGNIATGSEQRWTAQPFTIAAPGADVGEIDVEGFRVAGFEPATLNYIIWTRSAPAAGNLYNPFPNAADQLFTGSVPTPPVIQDPRIGGEAGTYQMVLPSTIHLNPGNYYLTIYGANPGGAQANFAWFANAQVDPDYWTTLTPPQPVNTPIVERDATSAFMWRQTTFPPSTFIMYRPATITVDPAPTSGPGSAGNSIPAQNPDYLWNCAFRILGAPPQGACCAANGTCSFVTNQVCTGAGGAWAGASVPCASANCPQPGACCATDGTCSSTTDAACYAANGVYRGNGSACASGNCAALGACCLYDGTCAQQNAATCRSTNGLFRGAGSACGTAANCPTTYAYAGGPVFITDAVGTTCGAQVFAEINVTDSFTLGGADVSMFATHTWQGDLQFWLKHVQTGTTVRVVNQPSAGAGGFGADNYGASPAQGDLFRLVDSAPSFYRTNPTPFGVPPAAGVDNVHWQWKPESPLSAFAGENSAGTWQLIAQDCGPGDFGNIEFWILGLSRPGPSTCYANCDNSTTPPVANVADFTCFLQKFAANDPYANCDGSTTPPTINVADFTCFLQKFAAGCP